MLIPIKWENDENLYITPHFIIIESNLTCPPNSRIFKIQKLAQRVIMRNDCDNW